MDLRTADRMDVMCLICLVSMRPIKRNEFVYNGYIRNNTDCNMNINFITSDVVVQINLCSGMLVTYRQTIARTIHNVITIRSLFRAGILMRHRDGSAANNRSSIKMGRTFIYSIRRFVLEKNPPA